MTRSAVAAMVYVLAGAGALIGQGANVSAPAEIARLAHTLAPGQWVWAPTVAPTGPILVYVDLSRQLATVYRNGIRIGVSTISSGKQSFSTPTGVFTILQKAATHHSRKYNNAPMPYTQRLTWEGIALHAGGLPGYPVSHGCIHLPYAFSKELFGATTLGATVVVAGNAQSPVSTVDGSLLSPLTAAGSVAEQATLDREEFRWTPQRSPSGPLTIVLSKSDQRIIVLRNGLEIGRSAAVIDDPDPGSHVISLTTGGDGKPRWIYVGIPGHDEDHGRQLDQRTVDRVRMPRKFYEVVKDQLRPGTTILVTQSSVGADTGHRITIMDSVVPQPY